MNNITDYEVRVWDDDIFIHGRGINFFGGFSGEGTQCNYDIRSSRYNEILSVCKEIENKFLQLNKLTNEQD